MTNLETALVFAILATPVSIWIQARVTQRMIDRLFEHLGETQVLGNTTVGIVKQQNEMAQEQALEQNELARKQMEMMEQRSAEREALEN